MVQDKIYQSYHININYNESDKKLTATAVFRFAGCNGTTLVMNKPGNVELGEEELKVDSSNFRGTFNA